MEEIIYLSDVIFSDYDRKRGIIIPDKLTHDIAYISGILAGDGHLSKDDKKSTKNLINCGGNPKDEKEFYEVILKSLLKKLFNIDINPRDLGDGTYGFRFESKALMCFFHKVIGLPRGKKYDTIKIPDLFLEDKNLILGFVRGLFDTDFGLCLARRYGSKPYYPQICFDSKSESFAKEIWQAVKLLGLQFNGKVYMVYDKDERAKAGYTITYRFDMYGHKYFIQILRVIGFRHPKHFKKYNEWLEVNKNNKTVLKLITEDSGRSPG